MSESSAKSSTKKGFQAPVLKVSDLEKRVESNEVKLNPKKEKTIKKDLEKRVESNEVKLNPKKEKTIKKKHEGDNKIEEDETSSKKKKIVKKLKESREDGKSEKYPPKETKFKEKNVRTVEDGKCEASLPKEKKFKKPEVSLTDSQYEDIFKAVLRGSNSQHSTPIEDLLEAVASSSQKSSVKGCQKEPLTESEGSAKTLLSLKGQTSSLPELSAWGSHLSKQNSQASSILKELQQSQASSLLSPEPTSSSEDTEAEAESQHSGVSDHSSEPQPQTQPRRRKVDKRAVLEELQAARDVGLWVFCDRISCQKQRYLPHVTDPQDLPDIWYCHMNPDPRYNSCTCEEQRPSPEEEEDMIDNQFTCGSVVWAQITGFPWWPAMVDDDPDLECYYWLDERDMRSVTFYHVVFFDKNEVTRAWIPINKIVSFRKNPNMLKQRVMRGIDFTPRLRVAREQAAEAASMTVVQRLKKYSFIARYKGPIYDDQTQVEKTKKKYKLKCSIGKKEAGRRGRKRRANTSEENPTPFESLVKSYKGGNDQRKLISSEKKMKKKSTFDKDAKGLDTNVVLSKNEIKLPNKDPETESLIPLSSEVNILMETHKNLSSNIEEQSKKSNQETGSAGKVTAENKDNNVSETSSEIVYPTEENTSDPLGKVESKPASVSGSNRSQKVGSSMPAKIAEDSLGSVVEPSQAAERPRAEDEDSQLTKLSQSTIADYLAATESEDAVVPEAFSQQSEPFEE